MLIRLLAFLAALCAASSAYAVCPPTITGPLDPGSILKTLNDNNKALAAPDGCSAQIVTPYQFGGKGDVQRFTNCVVTTQSGQKALSVATCSPFKATDVGKILVVNDAGASATTPLVTVIEAVTDATHATMHDNAGQTLAGVQEPITFGHDDAIPLQSCFTASATGATCSIPTGLWGSTQTLELYPGSDNATVMGAGRYKSQIVALAPLSSLVHRAAGYSQGEMLLYIGFDGSKLTADVGYFVCSVHRHEIFVGFYNASTDANLVYGDDTGHSANCNGSRADDLELWNDQTFYSGNDYPSYNMIVGSTDVTLVNVRAREAAVANIYLPTFASGLGASNDIAIFGAHVMSPNVPAGSTGILMAATKMRVYDPICDNGILICVDIQNSDALVFGGLWEGDLTSTAIGVNIATGADRVTVRGFNATTITAQTDRVKVNTPIGSWVCVSGNLGAVDNCKTVGGFNVGSVDTATLWKVTDDIPTVVNHIEVSGGAANNAPFTQCVGSDTDVNCRYGAKGAGTVKFTSHQSVDDHAAAAPTACGTNPSVSGTDSVGTVTVGSGGVTSCQFNFGQTWLTAPKCIIAGVGTGTTVLALSLEPTTAHFIVVSSADMSSQKFSYRCTGL